MLWCCCCRCCCSAIIYSFASLRAWLTRVAAAGGKQRSRAATYIHTYITKSVSMFLPRLYEVKSNLGGLEDGADWRIYNIGISRMQMKTFRARRADTGATVLVLWVVLLTHTRTPTLSSYTHTITLTRFAWKINSAIRLRLQRLDSFLKLFGSKMKNCTRHALISYNTCTHTNV